MGKQVYRIWKMSKLTSSFLAHEIVIISQNLEIPNKWRISAQYTKTMS